MAAKKMGRGGGKLKIKSDLTAKKTGGVKRLNS